jgi:hypothetical protein
MNSAALRFVCLDAVDVDGYGDHLLQAEDVR